MSEERKNQRKPFDLEEAKRNGNKCIYVTEENGIIEKCDAKIIYDKKAGSCSLVVLVSFNPNYESAIEFHSDGRGYTPSSWLENEGKNYKIPVVLVRDTDGRMYVRGTSICKSFGQIESEIENLGAGTVIATTQIDLKEGEGLETL